MDNEEEHVLLFRTVHCHEGVVKGSFYRDDDLMKLNQSGILWDGVVKSQRISIFSPDEIIKPELELLIVLLD